MTAKTTTVGLKEPVESRLDGITGAYSPKIDRSAMRTVRGEQAHGGADHNPASAFAARLTSRAALSSSGFPRSGSDNFTRSVACETSRLWRFCDLLFMRVLYPAGIYSLTASSFAGRIICQRRTSRSIHIPQSAADAPLLHLEAARRRRMH